MGRSSLALLAAALALAGCGSVPAAQCPSAQSYSLLDQQKLASELPSDGPETQIWLEDYRDLLKACGD